jgi:hypothetical protein
MDMGIEAARGALVVMIIVVVVVVMIIVVVVVVMIFIVVVVVVGLDGDVGRGLNRVRVRRRTFVAASTTSGHEHNADNGCDQQDCSAGASH